jgi:hypothetical protein
MNLPADHQSSVPPAQDDPPVEALPTPATAPGAAEATAQGAVPVASRVPWRIVVREWIADHDHSWLFVGIYLGLAVVLSVFVSLFWLVFMAGLHLLLECIRHWRAEWSTGRILAHSVWEVKLDFALVLLALGMAIYIDVMLGILGIQSAARAAAVTRAGARAASRVAAWERNLRGFLLTVDEMVRVGRALVMLRRGRKPESLPAHDSPQSRPWRGRWSLGDRIAVGIGVACVLLILGAPLLTSHSWDGVAAVLLQELRPIPS